MVSIENDDPVAAELNSREELFLKAREQRTSIKKIHKTDPNNEDDIESRRLFWSGFKRFSHDWKERVQRAVQESKMDNAKISSSEVDMSFRSEQKSMLELDQLQQELNELRHFCLQSKDTNPCGNSLSPVLLLPPDDLPLADLRLLHRDFTALQTQLDAARKEALPNHEEQPMFVFRKYRRYLLQQQSISQEETSLPRHPKMKAAVVPSRKKTFPLVLSGSTLEDYNNANIVLGEDGKVELSASDGSMLGASVATKILPMPITSDILVVRNVRHCNLHCHGRYKAIHFVSVHESSIHLEKPVEGAVHVTQCQHTSFHIARSQQLRLHESHHIECHIQVAAGTILEDCHHVTFYTPEGLTAADIKDFNWLRVGVPSPNFTIQRRHRETTVHAARHKNTMLSTPVVASGLMVQETSSHGNVEQSEQQENANVAEDDDEL